MFTFISKISKLNKIFFIRFPTYNRNLLESRIIFYKHLKFYDTGYSSIKPLFLFKQNIMLCFVLYKCQ